MHILLVIFCMLLTFGGGELVQDSWNSRKCFGFFSFSSVSHWFPTADWFCKVLSGRKALLTDLCSLAWHGGAGGRIGKERHDTFLSYPQCVVCFDILQASLSPFPLPKGACVHPKGQVRQDFLGALCSSRAWGLCQSNVYLAAAFCPELFLGRQYPNPQTAEMEQPSWYCQMLFLARWLGSVLLPWEVQIVLCTPGLGSTV